VLRACGRGMVILWLLAVADMDTLGRSMRA
jgi:hypothetical protein